MQVMKTYLFAEDRDAISPLLFTPYKCILHTTYLQLFNGLTFISNVKNATMTVTSADEIHTPRASPNPKYGPMRWVAVVQNGI